jgi:hypothetical protein
MTNQFTLFAAKADGVFERTISSQFDQELFAYVNAMLCGLRIAGVRGAIQFEIRRPDNSIMYAAIISFSDDLPNGVWNVTVDDLNAK